MAEQAVSTKDWALSAISLIALVAFTALQIPAGWFIHWIKPDMESY